MPQYVECTVVTPQPKNETFTVEVPRDAKSGSTLQVQSPSGVNLQVQVPQGLSPGQTFEVLEPDTSTQLQPAVGFVGNSNQPAVGVVGNSNFGIQRQPSSRLKMILGGGGGCCCCLLIVIILSLVFGTAVESNCSLDKNIFNCSATNELYCCVSGQGNFDDDDCSCTCTESEYSGDHCECSTTISSSGSSGRSRSTRTSTKTTCS